MIIEIKANKYKELYFGGKYYLSFTKRSKSIIFGSRFILDNVGLREYVSISYDDEKKRLFFSFHSKKNIGYFKISKTAGTISAGQIDKVTGFNLEGKYFEIKKCGNVEKYFIDLEHELKDKK